MRTRSAILISGRGSNMRSLIAAAADKSFPAEIVLVISNVADAEDCACRARGDHHQGHSAPAFARAKPSTPRSTRRSNEVGVEIVCLAGFMRILSDWFVRRWQGRLLNIHPSLLPAFKGVHVHEQALEAGVRMSGCTVHFVVPELDAGPIIAQAAVPVLGDTPEMLAARILAEEHKLYPAALAHSCRRNACGSKTESARVLQHSWRAQTPLF